MSPRFARNTGLVVASFVLLSLTTLSGQRKDAASGRAYPDPRFPAPMKAPKTVEEVMPFARALARNKSNILGQGLGIMNAGETCLIVDSAWSNDVIVQAILKALDERRVKTIVMHDYEIAGVSRADALEVAKASFKGTTEQGYLEASWWLEAGFKKGAEFIQKSRPDLYEKLFPKQQQLSPRLKQVEEKIGLYAAINGPITKYLVDWLQKHPEVRGVFYGKAGPIWMAFHPIETKWLGPFTADNLGDVFSPSSEYPADVWMLTEELTMEPLAYSDKVHVTDPEGTDVSWDLSLDQAQRWAKGVYLRGHLFMFPNEAYGQYALSVVDYPSMQKEYIEPAPIVTMNGVVAATSSHMGFIPRIEEHWKSGYLAEVKGGGVYGEVLRELLKYPKINETKFPRFDKPGYFYHYETALGTNPKILRHTEDVVGAILPERMRDGVMHWALGAHLWNDPGPGGGRSDLIAKFGQQTGMPTEHGYHLHTYFATYQVHLRNTDKWVMLTDRGRLASLENPEVRALASRYGNADDVLRTEWIPDMPGVNAPGRYEDYAADPYKHARAVIGKVLAGTYEHLVPASGLAKKSH